MPLTDEQRNALPAVRARFSDARWMPFGTTASLDERARDPDPGTLPADVTVRVEIAPPSMQPHPLPPSHALKTPERVPVYFFTLRSESDRLELEPEPDITDTHVILHPWRGKRCWPPHPHDVCPLFHPAAPRRCQAHRGYAQDLVAAYDYVLDKGYKSSNIVIAGDSAGGNHAVVLTHLVLQSDRPSPRGVIPIAPTAIQVYDRMSEYAKAQARTDIIGLSASETLTSAYVGDSGVARTDPLVSGAFIPFTESWPKTLILVGSADKLIDASRELEKRLSALKRPAELVEYDERPHGWWVLAHIFPDDIQDAAQRVARFVLR